MFLRVLDILFPPQCLVCSAVVPAQGTLCTPCWQQVRFITDPCCEICGLPFDFAMGDGALCGDCMRERPSYAQARAVFRYEENSRALVLKLKYADQTQLAGIYGAWLAKAGESLLARSDVIMPVPLHYWRLVGRRYNQAALLACELARRSNLAYMPLGLRRIRPTQRQAGLTRTQRQKNVAGAFAAHPRYRASIQGKNVLLVDDVMTTAATIEACSESLLKAGAKTVQVLTLARKI